MKLMHPEQLHSDHAHSMSPREEQRVPQDMAADNEEFERQFAAITTQELPNGNHVEYVVIKTAEGVTKPWVVFIGGFGTSKNSYKEEIASIVRSGRCVLFLNPAFDHRLPQDFSSDLPRDIPRIIRDEAKVLKTVLEREHVIEADFVAHSRGALVVAALLSTHPTLARKMIIDNPAGIVSHMSPWKITKRSVSEHLTHRGRGTGGNTPLSIMGQFKNHPLMRVKELNATARMDIKPLLKHIIEQRRANGVGPKEIILLNAYNDRIFPAHEVEHELGADRNIDHHNHGQNITDYADRWIYYANKDLGHGKTPSDELKHALSGLHTQLLDPEDPRNWQSIISTIVNEE